jgi:OOP family OmpA-OmpF porin
MSTPSVRSAALALLASLAAPAFAAAAPEKGPLLGQFLISPMLGYYEFADERNLDSTGAGAIGLGYQLTDRAVLEGVYLGGESTVNNDGRRATFSQYRLDVLYDLAKYQTWRPYVVGGVGAMTFSAPEDQQQLRDADTQLNLGVGARRFFTDHFSLRGDVRALYGLDSDRVDYAAALGAVLAVGGQPRAPADSDGDGVADPDDRCPGTEAGVAVDRFGCPLDSDDDGVADYVDDCPGTPARVRVDRRGCPLDGDRDGVFDGLDQCPNTPAGDEVDANGCTVAVEPVVFNLYLEFDNDSTDVRRSYFSYMEDVVAFLLDYPTAEVVLEGHTDSNGDAGYNQRLSEGRAESVKDYIVGEGIEADRIRTVGYGETRPQASNDTADGRQKNRRVSAVITGVPE